MADTSRSRARGALPEPAFCPILSPFISDLHHQSIRLVTAEIKIKVIGILRDTIMLAKYNYIGQLEDLVYKTANLLGIAEYRNPVTCKGEAKRIFDEYDKYTTLPELLAVGMGKQALKDLMSWINGELKLDFRTQIFAMGLKRVIFQMNSNQY